uniref:Skp1_POZ domain-containing protein n=1 Tax=Steinernema glaseri TaxID=37863 RepID=A0A1I7ZGU5_9BILA
MAKTDHSDIIILTQDGHRVNFNSKYVNKSLRLKAVLQDQNGAEGTYSNKPIKVDVKRYALEVIRDWCKLHENEPTKTDTERALNHYDRTTSKEDIALFGRLEPRTRFAEVINAATYLQVPDLLVSLQKYTANALEGKAPKEIAAWLGVKYNDAAKRGN